MARSDVAPAACRSAIVAARSAARAFACFVMASEAALRMPLVIVVPTTELDTPMFRNRQRGLSHWPAYPATRVRYTELSAKPSVTSSATAGTTGRKAKLIPVCARSI